jgi:hypothetical protein
MYLETHSITNGCMTCIVDLLECEINYYYYYTTISDIIQTIMLYLTSVSCSDCIASNSRLINE